VVEIGELWGLSEAWLRTQLNVALFLHDHLPGIWQLCRTGQLDSYRARMIADLARTRIEDRAQLATFADQVTIYLHRHLKTVPGLVDDHGRPVPPLVACTVTQLRNKLNYQLRPADDEDRHRKALAARRVSARDLDDVLPEAIREEDTEKSHDPDRTPGERPVPEEPPACGVSAQTAPPFAVTQRQRTAALAGCTRGNSVKRSQHRAGARPPSSPLQQHGDPLSGAAPGSHGRPRSASPGQ